MSAQQRMKVANEKASKNITQRGNVVKPVKLICLHFILFTEKPLGSVFMCVWIQRLYLGHFRFKKYFLKSKIDMHV